MKGIDISSTAINRLKEKYPLHECYEKEAGTHPIPFLDNTIKVVTASSVLYHLLEDESLDFLMKRVPRVL